MSNRQIIILLMMVNASVFAEVNDTMCMPKVKNQQELLTTLKTLPGMQNMDDGFNAEAYRQWRQSFTETFMSAAPNITHCKKGNWIAVPNKLSALQNCDFDATPASAAALGVCRYRGAVRPINKY